MTAACCRKPTWCFCKGVLSGFRFCLPLCSLALYSPWCVLMFWSQVPRHFSYKYQGLSSNWIASPKESAFRCKYEIAHVIVIVTLCNPHQICCVKDVGGVDVNRRFVCCTSTWTFLLQMWYYTELYLRNDNHIQTYSDKVWTTPS